MIINGASRRCVWWWSKHLQDEKENERVRVVKIEGLASENIYELLSEIEAQGLGTRCKNPLWIAAINPGPKEQFSEQDRDRAREILEQERGYQGQPYFMVEHEKKGWKHWHVIYSRVDTERMRVLPDGLDAKVCHAAARRIENELGLTKVIGPFDREPGTPRPARAPEPWEMYRGMQTKIDPRQIEAEVTGLFRQSETGKAFQAALESNGYQLATGERGLLILDSAGKEHSLARRIDGINTKELNAFMRDVDRQFLPTLEQAKEQYLERKISGLEADRATVRQEIDWEEALAKAAVEKEKLERRYVEPVERTTHQGGREKDNSLKAERDTSAGRPQREKNPRPIERPGRQSTKSGIKSPGATAKGAARFVSKALDFVGGALESLAAPTLTPEQIHEGERASHQRQAEAESTIDFTKYTAEFAQQRQRQESELEAERQRHREGGGRER